MPSSSSFPRGAGFGAGLAALPRRCFESLDPGFVTKLESFADFPGPNDFRGLVDSAQPIVAPPRFVNWSREDITRAGGYEQHVRCRQEVPTRAGSWHDLFNLAVWAHWPRVKWALNSIQCARLRGVDPNNGRAPAQNVAAQFDECGLLVESTDRDVLSDLLEHRFKRVFWEQRERLLASTRFFIVGHGSLEALLEPHPGLVGKALFSFRAERSVSRREARDALDREFAERIGRWRESPPYLQPVPLLGIPGYHDSQSAKFYDNARIFRPASLRHQAKSQGTNSAPSTSQA